MAETQIFYIGGSGVSEVRKGGAVTSWAWGAQTAWTKLKKPVRASAKKVKYSKSAKGGKRGTAGKWKQSKTNVEIAGTTIPATAVRQIDGVERTVEVRYCLAGTVTYSKPKSLRKGKKKKMYKYTYNNTTKPYFYKLQYRDKPITTTTYTTYDEVEGRTYAYFGDVFYSGEAATPSPSKIHHPTKVAVTYAEIRKNLESTANNNDSRDNSGKYVFTNVRSNVVTIELEWSGLPEEEGLELLEVLNKTKSLKTNGMDLQNNYLVAQYLDPQTGKAKNGVFFPSDRKVEKNHSGGYETISVTLTEV